MDILCLQFNPITQNQGQDIIIIPPVEKETSLVSFFFPTLPNQGVALQVFWSSVWPLILLGPKLDLLKAQTLGHQGFVTWFQMTTSEFHLSLHVPTFQLFMAQGISAMHLKYFLNSWWASLVFWFREFCCFFCCWQHQGYHIINTEVHLFLRQRWKKQRKGEWSGYGFINKASKLIGTDF